MTYKLEPQTLDHVRRDALLTLITARKQSLRSALIYEIKSALDHLTMAESMVLTESMEGVIKELQGASKRLDIDFRYDSKLVTGIVKACEEVGKNES